MDIEGEQRVFLDHQLEIIEVEKSLTERDEMNSTCAMLMKLVIEGKESITLRHINNLVLACYFHNTEESLDLRFQPSLVIVDVAANFGLYAPSLSVHDHPLF